MGRGAMGQEPRPADSHHCSGPPDRLEQPPRNPPARPARPGQGQASLPRTTAAAGLLPPGKSSKRQGLTSCRSEVTLPIPSLPPSPAVPIQQVLAFPTPFPKFFAGTRCQWSAVATRGGPVARVGEEGWRRFLEWPGGRSKRKGTTIYRWPETREDQLWWLVWAPWDCGCR